MICRNCGSEISDGSILCEVCGDAVEERKQTVLVRPRRIFQKNASPDDGPGLLAVLGVRVTDQESPSEKEEK